MDYFLLEANERLERLGTGLMALEHSPEDDALVNGLFREAHSLKGAASVSGAARVASVPGASSGTLHGTWETISWCWRAAACCASTR